MEKTKRQKLNKKNHGQIHLKIQKVIERKSKKKRWRTRQKKEKKERLDVNTLYV